MSRIPVGPIDRFRAPAPFIPVPRDVVRATNTGGGLLGGLAQAAVSAGGGAADFAARMEKMRQEDAMMRSTITANTILTQANQAAEEEPDDALSEQLFVAGLEKARAAFGEVPGGERFQERMSLQFENLSRNFVMANRKRQQLRRMDKAMASHLEMLHAQKAGVDVPGMMQTITSMRELGLIDRVKELELRMEFASDAVEDRVRQEMGTNIDGDISPETRKMMGHLNPRARAMLESALFLKKMQARSEQFKHDYNNVIAEVSPGVYSGELTVEEGVAAVEKMMERYPIFSDIEKKRIVNDATRDVVRNRVFYLTTLMINHGNDASVAQGAYEDLQQMYRKYGPEVLGSGPFNMAVRDKNLREKEAETIEEQRVNDIRRKASNALLIEANRQLMQSSFDHTKSIYQNRRDSVQALKELLKRAELDLVDDDPETGETKGTITPQAFMSLQSRIIGIEQRLAIQSEGLAFVEAAREQGKALFASPSTRAAIDKYIDMVEVPKQDPAALLAFMKFSTEKLRVIPTRYKSELENAIVNADVTNPGNSKAAANEIMRLARVPSLSDQLGSELINRAMGVLHIPGKWEEGKIDRDADFSDLPRDFEQNLTDLLAQHIASDDAFKPGGVFPLRAIESLSNKLSSATSSAFNTFTIPGRITPLPEDGDAVDPIGPRPGIFGRVAEFATGKNAAILRASNLFNEAEIKILSGQSMLGQPGAFHMAQTIANTGRFRQQYLRNSKELWAQYEAGPQGTHPSDPKWVDNFSRIAYQLTARQVGIDKSDPTQVRVMVHPFSALYDRIGGLEAKHWIWENNMDQVMDQVLTREGALGAATAANPQFGKFASAYQKFLEAEKRSPDGVHIEFDLIKNTMGNPEAFFGKGFFKSPDKFISIELVRQKLAGHFSSFVSPVSSLHESQYIDNQEMTPGPILKAFGWNERKGAFDGPLGRLEEQDQKDAFNDLMAFSGGSHPRVRYRFFLEDQRPRVDVDSRGRAVGAGLPFFIGTSQPDFTQTSHWKNQISSRLGRFQWWLSDSARLGDGHNELHNFSKERLQQLADTMDVSSVSDQRAMNRIKALIDQIDEIRPQAPKPEFHRVPGLPPSLELAPEGALP